MNDEQLELIISAVNQTKATLREVKRGIYDLGETTKKAGKGFDSFNARSSVAYQSLQKWEGIIVKGALVAGMYKFGRSLFSVTGELEKQRVAFTTMLGSANKANKLLKELNDLAKSTPFTIPGLRQVAKQLLAMGIEEDKLIDTTRRLGNISAGVSVDISRVALAFGQVAAKGKLEGGEIKQFTEAGIPLLKKLADMYGVTTAEVRKMSEAGVISFGDVEAAIRSMTDEGGQFYNLMQEQSKTLPGIFSNIKDDFVQMQEVFLDTRAYDEIRKMSAGFEEFMADAESAESVVEGFGATMVTVLFTIQNAIEAMVASWRLFVGNVAKVAASSGLKKSMFESSLQGQLGGLSVDEYRKKREKELASQGVSDNMLQSLFRTGHAAKIIDEEIQNATRIAQTKANKAVEEFQRISEGQDKQNLQGFEHMVNNVTERTNTIKELWGELGEGTKQDSEKVIEAQEQVGEVAKAEAEVVRTATGVMSSGIRASGQNIKSETEKIKEAYESLSETGKRELDKLNQSHDSNVDRIKKDVQQLITELKGLKSEYKNSLEGVNMSIGEKVVEQEQLVASLREQVRGGEAGQDVVERLKREEEALQAFMGEGGEKYAGEIEEARRRASLTDFERFMEDVEKRKTAMQEEFEKKKELLEKELDEKRAMLEAEHGIYEARKAIFEETIVAHDKLVTDYSEGVDKMKAKLDELVAKQKQASSYAFKKNVSAALVLEGRASGGGVNKYQPYIVGEKGPEFFIPGENGTIIPNDKLNKAFNEYVQQYIGERTQEKFKTEHLLNPRGRDIWRTVGQNKYSKMIRQSQASLSQSVLEQFYKYLTPAYSPGYKGAQGHRYIDQDGTFYAPRKLKGKDWEKYQELAKKMRYDIGYDIDPKTGKFKAKRTLSTKELLSLWDYMPGQSASMTSEGLREKLRSRDIQTQGYIRSLKKEAFKSFLGEQGLPTPEELRAQQEASRQGTLGLSGYVFGTNPMGSGGVSNGIGGGGVMSGVSSGGASSGACGGVTIIVNLMNNTFTTEQHEEKMKNMLIDELTRRIQVDRLQVNTY